MAKARKFPGLESIMGKVGTPIFVMAAGHLYDVGYRHLTEENVRETVTAIKGQDDANKYMSNDFSIHLVETAYEIKQAATALDLAKFLNKYTT